MFHTFDLTIKENQTYLLMMKVKTTREDQIGMQLISIRDFLNESLEYQNNGNTIELDFSNYSYSPPLLAVYFAAFLEKFKNFVPNNIEGNNYLSYQYFPNGMNIDEIGNWKDILNSYKSKSYLPLIHFSSKKNKESSIKRDNLLSHVNLVVNKIIGFPNNYYSAFCYLLSEITDNIVDHSCADYGWLSFQYFRSKGYLDLCIADSGIGLLQSYVNYTGKKDFSNIKDHLMALDNVIKGESTKHSDERGYGVHTSRKMLVEGWKGKFIMFTGIALLANYELVDIKALYNGTIAMLRVPCKDFNSNFDFYSYVE